MTNYSSVKDLVRESCSEARRVIFCRCNRVVEEYYLMAILFRSQNWRVGALKIERDNKLIECCYICWLSVASGWFWTGGEGFLLIIWSQVGFVIGRRCDTVRNKLHSEPQMWTILLEACASYQSTCCCVYFGCSSAKYLGEAVDRSCCRRNHERS